MVMDEETLEESITDYKQQLNQIDILLESCAEEESKIELMQLREDLGQLISITEDSLLSFKKSKLLQLLSESNDNDEYNTPEESDDATEIDGKDEKEEVDIMGLKCRAPFTFEWGGAEYHNAMIFCKEDVEDLKDEDENEKVRVLFLNPTHMSMLPCSFFMDGKCKFSEEECRYSHGQIVNIADLEDYREPDFSLISIDGQCLAKYEDGIWYKATVRDIEEDQITVHYDTYNEEMVLDLHSLLPVETKDNVSSSDDSSISDEENLQDGDFIADLSWRPSTNGAPLGEWEAHTKGFGSKLMASMGYIFGKGLGKDGQGRVEPVEITLLPAGKSLDKIAELREQGKLRKPGRRKKKKKLLDPENTNTIPGSSYKSSGDQGSDVFQFINSKLHSKANSSSEPTDARPRYNLKDSYKELKRTMNRKKKGESSQSEKGKYYNIQSYKSYEQLSAVKKKLVKQKEALSRNLGKDETMAAALRRNIKSTEEEIDKLEKNDQIISQRINSKSQSRKLAIF